jgi:hypothetical protein
LTIFACENEAEGIIPDWHPKESRGREDSISEWCPAVCPSARSAASMAGLIEMP